MGFSVMLRGAEKLVPVDWCPSGTFLFNLSEKAFSDKFVFFGNVTYERSTFVFTLWPKGDFKTDQLFVTLTPEAVSDFLSQSH